MSEHRLPSGSVRLQALKHVLWLQIAVDIAHLVGLRERIGELTGNLKRLLARRPAAAEHVTQRRSLDELHHDVEPPVAFAGVVDGDDAGVVQRRRRSGLLFESPDGSHVGGGIQVQHFDGYVATELRIPGAIHLTHPAGAERPDDLVWAEARPMGESHVLS
jgi:hypothetical protein